MSHTNTTTNYGLPQFLSSDKPAWMADINVAFADIDAQMKTNADAASAAQTTADDSVLNGAPGYSNLSTYAVGDVVNYLGRVYKCDIAVTTPEAFDNAKWSYYRLSDASSQLDVIDGEIGSTDISGIGDGSITGAISAVNSNLSELLAQTIVNGVQITPSNGYGHTSFNFTTPTGYYVYGAFVERVDNGNYDVVAMADPWKKRLSVFCPSSFSGTLEFNVIVLYKKSGI